MAADHLHISFAVCISINSHLSEECSEEISLERTLDSHFVANLKLFLQAKLASSKLQASAANSFYNNH